ncbi:uncharacterized protein K452DRAFT_235202 [Aplosporella prunicola CBS 121167]|uniref:Alpha/beta hydrolase fold-3 domain-containing protein n=1 Tax=Aplosporella prunicola CBS 121167 TaxID=1176127 RepID=A0A6A6B173_9PEZI|nr:uncharacterized protein K452DRAFT_235202 [Aplosporella prunicola CBS 121167]KAF2137942.1 hypothetical protein K452DRAFT_235202 [Aplosporella prunicola CBS 121167]
MAFPRRDPAIYFAGFTQHHCTYKHVNGHPIDLTVFVPSDLPRDTNAPARPVIARFHGGGLITGARLHPGSFAPWILELARAQGAVLVTPDYRLLPEARGADVLADVADFWAWLRSPQGLQAAVPDLPVDIDRVLAMGDSAGGMLALQAAFMGAPGIRALITAYPMVDLRSDHFTRRCEKNILGLPMLDEELVEEYIEAARSKPGVVLASADIPDRMDLMIAVFQHARFGELLGPERELYPFDRLEDVSRAGARLPPLLVTHGSDDSIMPSSGSRLFVEAWRRWQPEARVELVMRPGEHGFDNSVGADEEWFKGPLEAIVREWLGTGP